MTRRDEWAETCSDTEWDALMDAMREVETMSSRWRHRQNRARLERIATLARWDGGA